MKQLLVVKVFADDTVFLPEIECLSQGLLLHEDHL